MIPADMLSEFTAKSNGYDINLHLARSHVTFTANSDKVPYQNGCTNNQINGHYFIQIQLIMGYKMGFSNAHDLIE